MRITTRHDMSIDLPIITFRDKRKYVSYVPFLYVTGIGKTSEESIKDLTDGIETYFHGEDIAKLLKEKLPMLKAPISLELLRFNVEDNKIKPAIEIQ